MKKNFIFKASYLKSLMFRNMKTVILFSCSKKGGGGSETAVLVVSFMKYQCDFGLNFSESLSLHL